MLRRRFPVVAWIGRVDDAVYAAERAAVTTTMLVMSAAVCISVLYQFMARQWATVDRLGDGARVADLWPLAALALAIALLARGVWVQSPACRGNAPIIGVFTALATAGFLALAFALVAVPSKLVVAGAVLAAGVWVAIAQLDRPSPLGGPVVDAGTRARVAVVAVLAVAVAVVAWMSVPERYSWATKLALFLLLWTAFIGASMATHDGRHLTVDAVRKAIPRRFLPYYEALSHLIAAAFTAAFAWLAFLYLDVRLGESAAPGEIPDWLKVLAIPVSLVMVTLRFAARSATALAVGVLGLDGSDGRKGAA